MNTIYGLCNSHAFMTYYILSWGSWCHTKVEHTKSRYFVNPMSEFVHKPHEVHKHHTHIEKEFKEYKRKHGKSYKDYKDHSKRRNIYRHNAR